MAKFGGMAVPAAQLDLARPFREKLSCPFDERRQIFERDDPGRESTLEHNGDS